MLNTEVNIDLEAVRSFCARRPIQRLELFGSALGDSFGPASDLDFLVVYTPGTPVTLLDEAEMEMELEQLLGRPVDLVSRRAVEASENWIRREAILDSAVPVYAAA